MKARHLKLTLAATAALLLCLPFSAQAQAQDAPPTKEPQEADVYPGLQGLRGNGVDEQTVRDMQIKSWIDDALAGEELFDAASIDVKVENGVVHLAGEVPDEEALQLAERIASDTQYVSEVKNELEIVEREKSGY